MSVIVSFAPGAEGDAAVAEGRAQAARRACPLVVVCTVPTREAHEALTRLFDGNDLAQIVQNRDGDDAVELILDVIEKYDGHLLVVGLRRRSAVGKLVLGTSIQRLLLDSPCPVLTVKSSVQESSAL